MIAAVWHWFWAHWPLMFTIWVVVGIFTARFTLWERDEDGRYHKDPMFAWVVGIAWPPILLIGGLIGIVYGIGWALWKGVSIPMYYWVTPAKVRKSNGIGQFSQPVRLREAS